jgi:hypothetical protein
MRRTRPAQEAIPPALDSGNTQVFLTLTAADFRSGWALDWSPELQRKRLASTDRSRALAH